MRLAEPVPSREAQTVGGSGPQAGRTSRFNSALKTLRGPELVDVSVQWGAEAVGV